MKNDKDNSTDISDEVTLEQDNTLDDSVVAEENALDTVKKLREKLKTCISEKQSYLEGWQRERASFANLRKQDEKEKKEFAKYAKEEIVLDILPVLDSYEMARANKEAWEGVDKNWRVGVEYIFSQLSSVLQSHNLKEMNPIGAKYDPIQHEAIELVAVSEKEKDGVIVEVLNKGYMLQDKVVRPPKVKVGEYKEA